MGDALEHLIALAQIHVPASVQHRHGRLVRIRPYVQIRARSAREAAEDRLDQARQRAPETTGTIVSVGLARGMLPMGLSFRLKTEDSLSRKIEEEVQHPEHLRTGRRSYGRAARVMSDVLRYTLLSKPEHYTGNVKAVLADLKGRGYKIRSKNYWRPGDAYQGINVALTSPDGFPVELQFHTPESYWMKEHVVWPMYKRFRESTDNAERRSLFEKMVAAWAPVEIPPGVEEIPTEIWKPYKDLPGLVP